MGDGDIYSSQAEVQYVQCKTCHGTLEAPPFIYSITSAEDLALRLAFLNPFVDLQVGDTILKTERDEPIWNIVQQSDGSFLQIGKVTGAPYEVPIVKGSECEQKLEEQESRYCHACHAYGRP